MSFNFGGNEVKRDLQARVGDLVLADRPYFLALLASRGAVDYRAGDLSSVIFFELAGSSRVLVAGIRGVSGEAPPPLREQPLLVSKPWGQELWLTAENAPYCFKEIRIRRGHRTSLQYHQLKHETNVLVSGRANLVFRQNENDFGSVVLDAISTISVPPMCIHRLEALEDLHLLEISTPEVDDVVRISDDSGRGNGRIDSEHSGAVRP